MNSKTYQFSKVTMSDLPVLRQWLTTPQVCKLWGDPKEQSTLLLQNLRDSRMAMSMNIVSYNDLPFAFIQDYDVHAWQQPHLKGLPSGTRAIDTFIGIQSETGMGHGPAYLKQRAQHLLDNGATQVVIDPDIKNTRAIRAYEKAGFIQSSIENTSDGRVVLMHFQSSTPVM